MHNNIHEKRTEGQSQEYNYHMFDKLVKFPVLSF